jgi:hypothetical protein
MGNPINVQGMLRRESEHQNAPFHSEAHYFDRPPGVLCFLPDGQVFFFQMDKIEFLVG